MNEARLRISAAAAICEEHFSLVRDAETGRELEARASTSIQSHWRSYSTRKNFSSLRSASLIIQAAYRGYCGRKRAYQLAVKVAAEGRVRHFERAAVLIQRHWRGSYSRRRIHSFYDRKRYLQSVLHTGQQIQGSLTAHQEALIQNLLQEKETLAHDAFLKTLRGSHYLSSTEVCPGVYNSPWTAVLGGAQLVSGKSIEEHLRSEHRKALL